MGYSCGSAVVKFKTYQMTNGREIMNIVTREQTQMTENYAAEMLKCSGVASYWALGLKPPKIRSSFGA